MQCDSSLWGTWLIGLAIHRAILKKTQIHSISHLSRENGFFLANLYYQDFDEAIARALNGYEVSSSDWIPQESRKIQMSQSLLTD